MKKTKRKIQAKQVKYKRHNRNINFNVLKQAWDNMPSDMNTDEKEIFIEIAGKIIKEFNRMKSFHTQETDENKN